MQQIKLRVKILKSRTEKTKGLIGVTKLYPVYFETRFGIHTFGMKKSIDVFILDEQNKVVVIKKNLGPSNVFFWNPKYSKVIEALAGNVKLSIGRIVQLVNTSNQ